MKQESKLRIGVAALIAVIAITGVAVSSFASQGNFNARGHNYTPEKHKVMTQAFENEDYNAWKDARGETKGRGGMTEVINEENFSKFVEMRELRLAGDNDGADAIKKELGFECGNHGNLKGGNGGNHGNGDCQNCQNGKNKNRNFTDEDNNGICDRMQ